MHLEVKVSWRRQTTNRGTNILTKFGVSDDLCKVWLLDRPDFLLHVVLDEIPNIVSLILKKGILFSPHYSLASGSFNKVIKSSNYSSCLAMLSPYVAALISSLLCIWIARRKTYPSYSFNIDCRVRRLFQNVA